MASPTRCARARARPDLAHGGEGARPPRARDAVAGRRSRARSSRARAAMRPISESGCGGSPASFSSMLTRAVDEMADDDPRRGARSVTPTSSSSRAERPLDASCGVGDSPRARTASSRSWRSEGPRRGRHLEPGRLTGGALRERHTHRRRLARRTIGCKRIEVVVGERTSSHGCSVTARSSRRLGEVVVGQAETIDGLSCEPCRSETRMRSSSGTPTRSLEHRSLPRGARALPESHERAGRPDRRPWRGDRPRVGARGGGDGLLGHERRRSRRARRTSEGDVRRALSRRGPATYDSTDGQGACSTARAERRLLSQA